jgi:D-alanyl-D-alanine carboxypeptidase
MLLAEAGTDAAPLPGLQDDINAVLAEVAATPEFTQTTEPQPETMALANAAGTLAAPDVAEMAAALPLADPLPRLRPQARPQTAADTKAPAVLIAAGPDVNVAGAPDGLSEAQAMADSAIEDETPAAEDTANPAAPVTIALMSAPSDQPLVQVTAMTVPDPSPEAKTIRPSPEPRPDQIVLAAVEQEGPLQPVQQEIISRVSTSGGREYGINLGNFPSRYQAERMLLQTALVEMNTLDEALRKIVNRKGGFDANFVGMTEDMADLACRRLAARNADCRVIGP